MKLRNKKTGDIEEFEDITRVYKFIGNQNTYKSLAELNEEWEDMPEEPKEYWYISDSGRVVNGNAEEETHKQIGNYFSSREEAEKAVENLKAWKRLKDLGFRFKGNMLVDDELVIKYDFSNNEVDVDTCTKVLQDVRLLFGDYTNDE